MATGNGAVAAGGVAQRVVWRRFPHPTSQTKLPQYLMNSIPRSVFPMQENLEVRLKPLRNKLFDVCAQNRERCSVLCVCARGTSQRQGDQGDCS